MSDKKRAVTIANLQAAKAAIALQANWGTGELRTQFGGRMCALGAVAAALSLDPFGSDTYATLNRRPEVKALARAADSMLPDTDYASVEYTTVVWRLNDRGDFDDVHTMFDKAIETLQNQS